jgi:hypothetical protein
MLLRFDSSMGQDEIYYVEATTNHGTGIKKWSDNRKHLGKFYAKIVLRKLKFSRSE